MPTAKAAPQPIDWNERVPYRLFRDGGKIGRAHV